MNYNKLVRALLDRGFTPDRANEVAQWYFSPPGTPYPEFSNRLAICNSAKWDESKHKRDNDGRFSSTGGGGNPHGSDPEWRRIGQQAPSSVHTSKIDRLRKKIADDAELDRLMESSGLRPTSDQLAKRAAIDARRKRQEAELVRQEKHRQRLQREKQLDRGVGELERQLDDLETHIDSLEEGYADRNGGSTTSFDFPSPEAEEEYNDLVRQRDELESRIREIKSSPRKRSSSPTSRKSSKPSAVDKLLFEREEALHFAQRYSSNSTKRKAYEALVREIDAELDKLGVD